MKTYSAKDILITLGNHPITGVADDSFVKIEKNSDGITTVTGCYGEQVRNLDPDDSYTITLVILGKATDNSWLSQKYNSSKDDDKDIFPVNIKDRRGGALFTAAERFVSKPAVLEYGKTLGNREWVITTGTGTLKE